jgi:hypothetical protein
MMKDICYRFEINISEFNLKVSLVLCYHDLVDLCNIEITVRLS